jgi:photosystem II stability/assembly factor-like uncharacterized protein
MPQSPHGRRVSIPRIVFGGLVVVITAQWATLWAQQAGRTPAAPGDPGVVSREALGALAWRNIGPNRGGRSLAVAGSPSRPHEYYFGAVGGGLWKTLDGGTTWKPVTDGQVRSASVGAVAVAESDPDVVYIGMGEVALRGNVMQGDGVYKSTDGGKNWTHTGLEDSQVISRIRVHPTNPDIVFAAAFGHPAGPSEQRGVFRSTDGGKTWQRVLFRDARTGAVDLAIDRTNPNVVYAALWEAYRISYQMSSGGPGSGLFKSTDGGTTWVELTRKKGMPGGVIGKIGVSVSAADPNRVYAIVENNVGGVFRSDDGGETWTRVNEDRRLRQRAFYYSRIYADPKQRDTVYVLNTGFYKSTDGGATYTTIRVPHGDNHDLWIDPANPLRMANSNDGGGNVSVNGGETWTAQDYPTAQLYHVATTRDVPYHVCGAQQDNTTLCVPSDAGRPYRDPGRPAGEWLYTVGGGESGYVTPHPTDPDTFYAGSQGALLTWYNRATGHVRDVQVYPRFFSGEPSSALKERWQWTFPIVFSPHDSNVLYTSSQHLWRTSNGGQSWERISDDLSRADPKTLGPSGGPITQDMNGPEIFATIFTIAPSARARGLIWTGSDDGLVHVTQDEGRTWSNVTPAELPELSRVSMIEASSHDAGTAYVCAKQYLLGDRAPYIFRTRDFGKSWTKIVAGIRADDYVHTVREDPVRRGMLYAGTEHGVWVSWNAGDTWQSLSLNLPDTQVADLVVERHDLVAGTHGRSIWILSDLDSLRQMSKEPLAAKLHSFTPRPAIRSVSAAPLDYVLAEEAPSVAIEVLDKAGAVIRRVEGDAEAEKRVKEANENAEQGIGYRQPEPPSRKKGLNRWTWDLRYEGAVAFDGMILWGARADLGPVAVPGAYQIRITALGQTRTVPYVVQIDPRLKGVTDKDLAEQFDLAMQVRDRTSDANDAVARIRDVKAQIAARVPQARSPVIGLAADATSRALTEIESELYQVRNRSSQDPLNFPIKLNNRLAALRRSIETGDARPTDAAYVVFKELSAELDVLLERLKGVEGNQIVAFNRLLTNGNLETVTLRPPAPRK